MLRQACVLGMPLAEFIGRRAMAKGQMRSNREAKKPKKQKPAPAPASSGFTTPTAKTGPVQYTKRQK